MTSMTPDYAEYIGLQALGFVCGDDEALPRLVAQTGVTPDDLAQFPDSPEILGGVLDFLLSDEKLLIKFCEQTDIAQETPGQARMALPGAVQDYEP